MLRLALLTICVTVFSSCSPLVQEPTYFEDIPLEDTGPYRIQPHDELEVRFFYSRDLDVTLPVRPDGQISLPYAVEIQAAGRTPEELRRDLTERYDRILNQPEIAVIVRSFSSFKFHVGGEVESPGVFPLAGKMTVLDALFEAGGFLPRARLDEVVIIRKNPSADLPYIVIPVNLETVLDGTDGQQNIGLLPYDAVYVPPSPIANVNTWIDLYIRQNLPIDFGIRATAVTF
jgi:protein involved in polysaccharide export with SLBB domain